MRRAQLAELVAKKREQEKGQGRDEDSALGSGGDLVHSSDLREEINDVYADPAYKEGKGSRSVGKKNCSCLWYHSLRMSQKKDPIGQRNPWIISKTTKVIALKQKRSLSLCVASAMPLTFAMSSRSSCVFALFW